MHRGDCAVVLRTDFDFHVAAASRARSLEHIRAAHYQLDRPAALLGEHCSDRLQVNRNLATEAAADLHRRYANLRDRQPQNFCRRIARRERALSAAPDMQPAVRVPDSARRMRLDIALVDSYRVELALNYDVRLGEALIDIALHMLEVLRHIARRVLDGLAEFVRSHGLMQDRRAVGHSILHRHRRRKHLVLHLDELHGFLSDVRVSCGHRRDCVPLVQHFVPRQYVRL